MGAGIDRGAGRHARRGHLGHGRVDVVEEETEALAPVRERAKVREAVLRYSREVAFSAAQVYAQAAEARGAWDARLESLVVDA